MRKRLMNISKRCMIAIMSAAMVMSSVTVSMAFPVGVYAEDNYSPIDTLDHNIDTNSGNIGIVDPGVQVVNNGGTIDDNQGTVVNNYGNINNNSSGVVVNQYLGNVCGVGTVTNYFGGAIRGECSITNNFSDNPSIGGANQFYSVTLSNDSNITAEYGSGFTAKVVDAQSNVKQFIQVSENGQQITQACGQITISPGTNYELSLTQGPSQVFESFRYEININEGRAYLTIYSPTQSLTIDPTTLGLIISEIQNRVIDSVNTDNPSNGDVQQDSITDRIASQMIVDSSQNIIFCDYSQQSNLTLEEFVNLCKTRPDVAKDCCFICDGKVYILHVPANIDIDSDAFKSCLAKFEKEHKGLAGPLTIEKIFSSFGITCTTSERTDAKENNIMNQLANTNKSIDEAVKARDKYQDKYKNATRGGKESSPSRAAQLSRNNAIGDGNGGYIAQGGHVQINGGKSNVTFTLAAPTSGVLSSANQYANSVGGTLLHCVTTSSPGVSFKTATVNFTVTGVYANDTIAVYQLQGKNWVQVLVSSVTDNHVTVNLTQHGPLAFVRVAEVATAKH